MIGPLLRIQRQARGLSLSEIADRVGCAKSYLSAIETGRRPAPRGELLERLETVLGFEPGVLVRAAHRAGLPEPLRQEMQNLETDRREATRVARLLAGAIVDQDGRLTGALDKAYRSGALHQFVERFIASDTGAGTDSDAAKRAAGAELVDLPVEVPLINSVSAGYPREFTDLGYPARVADEYVRCPDLSDPDAFAARVVGDSMEPAYHAGDVVIFSPSKTLKSGQDCFARIEPDHETTFKRVYFERGERGEEVIRLQPINSRYAPRVLPRERVAGLYAAARVLRTLP
ncbi:MAG: S24 family peptidase [Planctomycetota bacterium]